MPDVRGRFSWENEIARRLAKIFRKFKNKAKRLAKGGAQVIPESFFRDLSSEERASLYPVIESIYKGQGQALAEEYAIGIDWGNVNEAAREWARQYTFELVKGIDGTTRKHLRDSIAAFFEDEMTIGDLEDLLMSGNLFGPTRAEMIAVTEVTRAGARGEVETMEYLRREYGLESVAVWQTNRDEMVCPICGPRHDQPRGTNWDEPPPAHPRCRCWIVHEITFDEEGA